MEQLRPLFQSAQEGHIEVCKLLIQNGAQTDVVDSKLGLTPLILAAQGNSLEIVQLLLDQGGR